MTLDDQDSVDLHDQDKHSKRGRLKDALNRTKTKINKVKEEREVKKTTHQQQEKVDHSNDADVNDFLSAGRPSSSSQRPSLGSTTSDVVLSTDNSLHSPRPSTSDSRSQPSPRRGPPLAIPRIDVSGSTRFPNAREVNPEDVLLTGREATAAASGNLHSALLKPEYTTRSQSSSSISAGSRKARIRGLSVGFAETPPVIIGEGGDEAEAPAIEISRAKARARSASPQGRRPYTNTNVQQEARKQLPPRGVSENTANAFIPKAFARTQTSGPIEATNHAPREPQSDGFVPKPFRRVQTGASTSSSSTNEDDFVRKPFSRTQTGFSRTESPESNRPPPMPARPLQPPQIQIRPNQLPPMQTTGLDLAKEFEMSLGLSPAGSSPATSLAPNTQIMAPKPQRAPPSYDLIESGSRKTTPTQNIRPPSSQSQSQDSMNMRKVSPLRKPVPAANSSQLSQVAPQASQTPSGQPYQTHQALYQATQQDHTQPQPNTTQRQPAMPQNQQQTPQSAHAQQQYHPVTQIQQYPAPPPQPLPVRQQESSQEMFPPPPQRTMTQTHRIPQKLQRIIPRIEPTDSGQETSTINEAYTISARGQSQAENDESYRSFADRQRRNPQAVPLAGQLDKNGHSMIRAITTQYDSRQNDQSGIRGYTPAANPSTPMSARYYENLNRGNAPEGFI